jgi:5-methylcytosine-specific restriction endonuclease McrA
MRLEILIFGITGFLLYNTYYDGKYTKMLLAYKKYYKMIFIGFLAICVYIMIKKNPLQGKNLLLYTNNMIKNMPIDKSSMDIISPIFDLSTKGSSFMNGFNNNNISNDNNDYNPTLISQQQRQMLTGQKTVKRAVSETKKKYVASMQDWKCGQCIKQLTHTFEIDHKIRLEHGGGNDVTNLVALCRECHGQKTAMENM